MIFIASGGDHQLVSISQMVADIKQEIGEIKQKMKEKEENLSSLCKYTSKVISEFEMDTVIMVKQLHSVTEKQVNKLGLVNRFLDY